MERGASGAYPTVIHGRAVDGSLRVTVYNVRDGITVFDESI